jgi:hypothetical protein
MKNGLARIEPTPVSFGAELPPPLDSTATSWRQPSSCNTPSFSAPAFLRGPSPMRSDVHGQIAEQADALAFFMDQLGLAL